MRMNTNRHIVDSPRQIGGRFRELARAIALQLIAWPISRHDAVDEWLGIGDFWKNRQQHQWLLPFNYRFSVSAHEAIPMN